MEDWRFNKRTSGRRRLGPSIEFTVRLSEEEFVKLKQRAEYNDIAVSAQARKDLILASRLFRLPLLRGT